MTDETPAAQPKSSEEAAYRVELFAEADRLGVKYDKRWANKRIEDAIAANGAAPVEAEAPAPTEPTAEEKLAEAEATLAAQRVEMDRLAAQIAAKDAEPTSVGSNAPAGMLTSAHLTGAGSLQMQEDERRVLMDRCAQVGIAHKIPPRAGNDAIREILGRHMTEKAQKMAVEEAQSRLKAKGPVQQLVSMRVLPLGHQKISKGIHVPGFGDECFNRGDVINDVLFSTAKAHEANGMGEILE